MLKAPSLTRKTWKNFTSLSYLHFFAQSSRRGGTPSLKNSIYRPVRFCTFSHYPYLTSQKEGGFSLVEVILATSIFALSILMVMGLYFYSISSIHTVGDRARALFLAREGIEATINMRDAGYSYLVDGDHGLAITDGHWAFLGTSDITDKYTRIISISPLGLSTKLVTSTVSWIQAGTESVTSFTFSTQLALWTTLTWFDSSASDFGLGTYQQTLASTTNNGEVQLQEISYSDWCSPGDSLSSANLPGEAIVLSVATTPSKIALGVGTNLYNLSFINNSTTNTSRPSSVPLGTRDGVPTNAIASQVGYVYLASDTSTAEIAILDTSALPYTQIGLYDAPGNSGADTVFVAGNTGYMTSGNSFQIFDLSAKTGTRSQIGSSVTLANNANGMVVVGSYAYVSLDDSTIQLQIIDISTPASASVVGDAQIESGSGRGLSVSSDGDRAYLITALSPTAGELHIINTATKSGTRPILGSYESNSMDPVSVVAVADIRVIIVGQGGTHQYQVVDISDTSSPVQCAGLTLSGSARDIAWIDNYGGNTYAYIVTDDTDAELQIIRGGSGGPGGGLVGYSATGDYTSRVYDVGHAGIFHLFSWIATIPAETTLHLQIRSGASSDLSAATWYGPDGTAATYFTIQDGEALPSVSQGDQYIQYRAYFTTDGTVTPALGSIRLYFE